MIKALYTFAELAALLGVSARRARKIVGDAGIACLSGPLGYRKLVPLAEFQAKCPLVWESVAAKEKVTDDDDG